VYLASAAAPAAGTWSPMAGQGIGHPCHNAHQPLTVTLVRATDFACEGSLSPSPLHPQRSSRPDRAAVPDGGQLGCAAVGWRGW
jgi:hypothetical protein